MSDLVRSMIFGTSDFLYIEYLWGFIRKVIFHVLLGLRQGLASGLASGTGFRGGLG